ncbi:F-box domain, FIST C domain protein [Artemisia annua]|uniref:F-box domain, FIST C domain protein n=1 Tax=Artemisia annua TaxID=35608 RepID=A0A2U1QJY8_ARTAN|nr:F-box domain, FIST C domain protein [Artemisia annua]
MTSAPPQPPPLRPSLDIVGEDLLQNIFTRLPATSFAYAACVSRSWHVVCDRVLCRPKLKSACSFNSSLQDAVEDVMNKVLDEPIRPHFVIASVGPSYNLTQAHQLITAKLGPNVPIITNNPSGVIGRDAVSNEFKEIQWEVTEEDDDTAAPLHLSESANRAIMLIIGFLPGIKVEAIPLLKRTEEPPYLMVDNFVTDIREFSTSVSGCKSPAAIIMFSEFEAGMKAVAEKMDYALSPDTVIVGDGGCHFLHSNGCSRNPSTSEEHSTSAVALVFAVDSNKPPGIGETQFHATLSSGLSSVGPTYKAASVREKNLDSVTWLTARIEGTNENIDGETILSQVYDELGDRIQFPTFYIGVTKKRKCAIGKEKVGLMTSLAFHEVLGDNQEYLFVGDVGIRTGDTFRFYHSDSTTALSSITAITNQFSSLKQASTSNGDKREVFGGLIFTCCGRGESFFGQSDVDSSPFLDNFPGVTFAGTFCGGEIGRGDLTSYVKESPEQKSIRCCLHVYSAVYLVMSYTPPNGNQRQL